MVMALTTEAQRHREDKVRERRKGVRSKAGRPFFSLFSFSVFVFSVPLCLCG